MREVVLGLFAIACAGCATQPSTSEMVMSGSWSGAVSATSTHQSSWYQMVLTDTNGVVTGSGTWLVGNDTTAITISGARSGVQVSLDIRYDASEQDNFTGMFVDATHVNGTIAGSVAQNDPLVLSE